MAISILHAKTARKDSGNTRHMSISHVSRHRCIASDARIWAPGERFAFWKMMCYRYTKVNNTMCNSSHISSLLLPLLLLEDAGSVCLEFPK